MDPFLLDNFLFDEDMDFNVIQVAVDNLAAPINVVPVRNVPTYNVGYEDVIRNYSLTEFKNHFRLSRPQVAELINLLAPVLFNPSTRVLLDTKIQFFLWTLAKQESFLATSDRFGFSKGTGHYIFCEVLDAVIQLKRQFIKWPLAEESREIANRIECRSGIPGVVGFIDGCHIAIKQPVNNAIDYFNRKQFHSVILQGVCNDKAIFTDVFIGIPGRIHDARVFRLSPLYEKLVADPPLLTAQLHIIGDSAYPLMQNLLKPYRDNGHLTGREDKFNKRLAGQRQVIERAFGLLKGRWRRLKYLDMSLPEKITQVILAACILHNFISHDEDSLIEANDDQDVIDEGNVDIEVQQNISVKRDYISTLL